jgi:hypothetical protein
MNKERAQERTSESWDADAEATAVFALTGSIKSVIVSSDVEVIRRSERGPARRIQKRTLDAAIKLVKAGKLYEAKALIMNAKWPGPPTLWWTDSPEQLALRIAAIDAMIHERRIGAGINSADITNKVALLSIWWDRP